MCSSLITPILLAIETVTDMKPEEARKHAKFTPKSPNTKLSNMFVNWNKEKQLITAQNSISTKICIFCWKIFLLLMHLFAKSLFSHKILQNWSFLCRLWIAHCILFSAKKVELIWKKGVNNGKKANACQNKLEEMAEVRAYDPTNPWQWTIISFNINYIL